MGFSQALRLKETLVHPVQPLLLRLGEQGIVLNVEQVIDDEPYWLFGSHPVLTVEALEIHWNRVAPESALAAQVEVGVEVTQCEFAQRAIDRLAPPAARVI